MEQFAPRAPARVSVHENAAAATVPVVPTAGLPQPNWGAATRLGGRLTAAVDKTEQSRAGRGRPVPSLLPFVLCRSGRRTLPSSDRWPPGVRIAHTARPVAGDVVVVRHDFRNPEIEKLGAGLAGVASLVPGGRDADSDRLGTGCSFAQRPVASRTGGLRQGLDYRPAYESDGAACRLGPSAPGHPEHGPAGSMDRSSSASVLPTRLLSVAFAATSVWRRSCVWSPKRKPDLRRQEHECNRASGRARRHSPRAPCI